MTDNFIVICREDRIAAHPLPAPYRLATRRVFSARYAADAYAATINPGREPLVVAGDFLGGRLRSALQNAYAALVEACARIDELGGDSGDWTVDLDSIAAAVEKRNID